MPKCSRHRAATALLALSTLLAVPAGADERYEVLRLEVERLASLGRCDEALDVLGTAQSRSPESAELWRLSGACLIRLRRYGDAVGPLEKAKGLDPQDAEVGLELGVARYHLGDLDGARAELDAVEGRTRDEARLDLYRGLLLLQGAETREAALALERARRGGRARVEPVASYYAGLAWRAEGERERAETALQRVIDEEPDSVWAEEARRALAASARPGWWAETSAGMEWDSNVVIRGDNIAVPDSISDKNDWRGVWSVDGATELYREGNWSAGAGAGYAGNSHVDLSDFNTHVPTALGWVDYQIDPKTSVRLRYDYLYAWIDESPYLSAHLGTVSVLRRWDEYGETEVGLAGGRNGFLFHQPNSERRLNRDGERIFGYAEHTVPFDWQQSEVRAGYLWERYWAEGSEYDGWLNVLSAGAGATLPWDVRVEVDASISFYRFDSPSVLLDAGSLQRSDDDREDDVWQVVASVRRPITEKIDVEAAWQFTDSDSDRDVFTYDRQIFGVYFTYRIQ